MRSFNILYITLLINYSSFAQSVKPVTEISDKAFIRVLYRLTFQPDSLNPAKTIQEDFKLLHGKTTSLFVSANRPKRDSAMDRINEQANRSPGVAHVSLVGIPKTWFSFYIYKTFTSQQLTTFEQILTKHYRIEETSEVLHWRISPDTQRVAGYTCRQATVEYGGRHWRAWFTNEVPVSDGPYKFSGLPGLIVRVQDAQSFYTFELTSLASLSNGPAIVMPSLVTRPATREQMRQTMYNYQINPFAFMSTHGDPVDAADQQRYRERSKARNNAIERH